MIKYFFYLSLYLSHADITSHLSSAIFEKGIITVFDQDDYNLNKKPSMTIYKLKDGPMSDIKGNSTQTSYKLNISNMSFLKLPSTLKKDKSSQLWLIVNNKESKISSNIIEVDEWTYRWTGADTISDNDLISIPADTNFPRGKFSVTGVDIDNNPYLYVLGGIIYSTKLNSTAITNYFYQYDFNANKWSDLSDLTNNILTPMAYHNTFQVGNSLITIPGSIPNAKSSTIPQYKEYKHCNMTDNIDKIYKFDLQTNKWSAINVDINMGDNDYPDKTLYGRSISVYNGKILVYANILTNTGQFFKPVIGLLDLDKAQWSWNSNIGNLDIYRDKPLYPESIVINDQLFLINGVNREMAFKQVIALNLNTTSFTSTIDVDGKKNILDNINLPTYAIVLIVLAAIAIIIIMGWLYYRRRIKLKNEKESKEKIEAVWASSDIENDARYSKNRGFNYNRNTPGALGSNSNGPNNRENTDTALNETNIMNLPYFQHEVDVEDMSPANAADQDKTS